MAAKKMPRNLEQGKMSPAKENPAVARAEKAVSGKKVMTASQAAKKARTGADMGAKGKNFAKIAASAGAKYGSAAAGKRVAGAIFQAKRKAGTL